MLRKLTKEPADFGAADIEPLLQSGLRPEAIEHAILIGGYLFNMHNRLVDALGCDLKDEHMEMAGRALDKIGRKLVKARQIKGQTIGYAGEMPETVQQWVSMIVDGRGKADPELRKVILNRSVWWQTEKRSDVAPVDLRLLRHDCRRCDEGFR